jgi:isoamylase
MSVNTEQISHTNQWIQEEGSLDPQGATWLEEEQAWNFVLYSVHARQVTLLLYSEDNVYQPVYRFDLIQWRNKTGPLWHCRIPAQEIENAKYYAYRVDGPKKNKQAWHSFDKDKILLDPYAKAVYFPPDFDRVHACQPGSNEGKAPLGVLIKNNDFEWGNDRYIRHGSDLVIYEMHVKGFTKNSNSGVSEDKQGTFAGVIEKIPYLKELGVTAVELMPVFQYDPKEGNYWGYMTLNFFAPHHDYCTNKNCHDRQIVEFREMVKALHDADIEVILDVVFNHTCEGDNRGPIYSFKGIDNDIYYLSIKQENSPYANLSGCGNTLDSSNTAVKKLIIDSLRYWRDEMHVDGFRFDLASVFARDPRGDIDQDHPPIIGQITSDKGFLNVRLIAEPWDAAGTYQLGRAFPGWMWMQWNGKFRETMQKFVKGDQGMVPELMTRLYGSSDLFPDDLHHACRPWQSVNYIISHDGSTLHDLVSYQKKYNEINGHNNTDGSHEFKWNCGWEGVENVPETIRQLRNRQVKNYFCLLMLANGSPMIRMGDEFLQTQNGNNNPYNQDNEISWLDWSRLDQHQDMFRFVKMMIAFRKTHPSLSRSHFWRDDIHWYGTNRQVDLEYHSQSLAFCLLGHRVNDQDIYVMINAYHKPLEFEIQETSRSWKRVVDTSLASPEDIISIDESNLIQNNRYTVKDRSIVVLVSHS